eukprot:TRINITY_DN63765_c0_g1_i1.p1 TRINITY_DN63765_c0_g1~~TRINITY_DN63765_c0_g1_i1.p1  ORF type:complete len:454 (-),score=72.63 TRINITY_DN63765_c0_g1_i1:89-1450(-)
MLTPSEDAAQEPLRAAAEDPRVVQPRKFSCCCVASTTMLALALAVGAGLAAYFLQGRGSKLSCSIQACVNVMVPRGATNCSSALCESCSSGLSPGRDGNGSYCGASCQVAHCATSITAARGGQCSEELLRCPRCQDGWELELDESTLLPTGNCSFSCTAQQLQTGCAHRSCQPDGHCSSCLPGFRLRSDDAFLLRGRGGKAGVCDKEEHAVSMQFYMYRAQDFETYPPENTDLASAAGVMWYLHNEVVKLCPRHYNISRVLRYKVTVFNPPAVFNVRQGQFGHYVAFDSGMCTVPNCTHDWWDQFGYSVGCQLQDEQMWKYEDSYWYSLPGRCPSQTWNNKSKKCLRDEPGGSCARPDGSRKCTWNAEPAGQVSVDALSQIEMSDAWCAAGNIEYDEKTDRGRGTDFWDDKFNSTRNKQRVLRLLQLFASEFDAVEQEWKGSAWLPAPQCDGF